MKHLLFILIFPMIGFAQIDLSGYTIQDTAITLPDTLMNNFMDTTITLNGSLVTLYQAQVIRYKDNKKNLIWDSGIYRSLPRYKAAIRSFFIDQVRSQMDRRKEQYLELDAIFKDGRTHYLSL